VQRLSDRKEELFREVARGKIEPLPGAMELITSLHARGFRLAIASSTPRSNLDVIAADLGLYPYFPVLLCGDDVRRGKPAPDLFLTAAERLGVPPPNCVVLEDAVGGVQAAKAGGMKCVAITTTQPRERLGEADWIVDSLEEVTVEQVERLLAAR
jgi:HAD superfamily hydrolase (TIGR01509 family)